MKRSENEEKLRAIAKRVEGLRWDLMFGDTADDFAPELSEETSMHYLIGIGFLEQVQRAFTLAATIQKKEDKP